MKNEEISRNRKIQDFHVWRPLRARIFDSEAVFAALTRNLLNIHMACRDGTPVGKQYVSPPAQALFESARWENGKMVVETIGLFIIRVLNPC